METGNKECGAARRRGGKRQVIALTGFVCGVLVLGTCSFALAASLTTSTQKITAGGVSTAACGTLNSLTATFMTSPQSWIPTVGSNMVYQVTVTGIPTACNGQTANFSLVDGSNASLYSSSATIASGSFTSAIISTSGVTATNVSTIRIAIVGP